MANGNGGMWLAAPVWNMPGVWNMGLGTNNVTMGCNCHFNWQNTQCRQYFWIKWIKFNGSREQNCRLRWLECFIKYCYRHERWINFLNYDWPDSIFAQLWMVEKDNLSTHPSLKCFKSREDFISSYNQWERRIVGFTNLEIIKVQFIIIHPGLVISSYIKMRNNY